MNSATTSSSSTTTVDDISNDIGRRIDISKDVDDISRIDISGGQEEKICNNDKGTSCDQKLEHKKVDYDASNDDVDSEMVSGDIGKDIDAKDICANCGKEGANNTCNKCKQVKYCNAACKKRHRHKHKKDCEEYLRCAAELRDIELFKRPPLIFDDCPICFQRLPNLDSGKRFQACCGKEICCGCIYAVVRKGETDASLCPFCRTPAPESNKEVNEQLMKRVDVDDAEAIHNLGFYYSQGLYGLPQDWAKAFELRLHAPGSASRRGGRALPGRRRYARPRAGQRYGCPAGGPGGACAARPAPRRPAGWPAGRSPESGGDCRAPVFPPACAPRRGRGPRAPASGAVARGAAGVPRSPAPPHGGRAARSERSPPGRRPGVPLRA